MTTLRRWIFVLATTFLCGCFQIEDDLAIQADGSGTVKMTLHSDLPEELVGMLSMSSGYRGRGAPIYPPAGEADARRFFPPKDFTLKVDQRTTDEGRTITIEAAFKDVNALLASPYGRAHQLLLKTNANGTLQLQTLSGASTLAQAAQFKAEGQMASFDLPGMDEAQRKKGHMRFAFRVTLPRAITEANGAHESNTVTWAVERAKCKDDDEFAARLSGLLEATCSAQGLTFSPVTPPRLGLLPFNQLVAGEGASSGALPDTNQILTSARFVPYLLHVTRSLDLSGEGFDQESGARLAGAVVLPAEFAPHRWGQVRLEEAVDAKGNSLMPKEAELTMSQFERFTRYGMQDEPNEEDQDDSMAPKAAPEKLHPVMLSFKAPEWRIKRIARIRGILEIHYLGGSEVIKLSNAVPPSLVMDMTKRASSAYGFDSERGQVTDQRLGELGLSLRVQMAMVQRGMTMLSLQTSGARVALADAQLFDVEGKPWATTLVQGDSADGEERSCQLLVAGRPKPPFSLALEVGRVGATVGLPVVMENVPVGDE